jgi:hypothetical protein
MRNLADFDGPNPDPLAVILRPLEYFPAILQYPSSVSILRL